MSNETVRIYYTNAQSFRNTIDQLEPEVVCLSETWLGGSVPNEDLEIGNFSGPYRRNLPGH